MNRGLWVALLAVGGMSLYLSTQPDDGLLAPGKGGGARPPRTHERASAARGGGHAGAHTGGHAKTEASPWAGDALVAGVTRWQQRWSPDAGASQNGLASATVPAWAGVRPPPPPPPPPVILADPGPPPPPMAPRFPHAWVGAFNDEAVNRAIVDGPRATWVVQAGDVIEGQWRVDSIEARTMRLTYLPLQQQQTVAMK